MSRNLIYISYKLDSRVSHYAGVVLDCLLTFGDQALEAAVNIYPCNQTLATRLKLSLSTIIRAKNQLESLGLIVRYYDETKHRDMVKVPFSKLDEYLTDKSVTIEVSNRPESVTIEEPDRPESVTIEVSNRHTTLPDLYVFKSNNIYKEKKVMPIALKNKGPEFADLDEQYEWLTTKISEMKQSGEIQGEARCHLVADLVSEISFHIEHRAPDITSKHAANAALKWLREGRWQVPMKLQMQRKQLAEEREKKYNQEKEAERAEEVKAYRQTLGGVAPIRQAEEDRTEDLIKYIEQQNQHGISPRIKSRFKYAEPILRLKGLSFYFAEDIDIGQQSNYNG